MSIEKQLRLLFICLGNICRSPAAEAVMRKKVEERGLSRQFHIESAGIGGWHVGELPDRRMREHASKREYELISRAQQFEKSFFQRFDYIIVMDDENYSNVMMSASNDTDRQKVLRMRDYFMTYKGEQSVPDPYYGGPSDFELALDLIEDGCEGLLSHKFIEERI